jgi:hypothetical protein
MFWVGSRLQIEWLWHVDVIQDLPNDVRVRNPKAAPSAHALDVITQWKAVLIHHRPEPGDEPDKVVWPTVSGFIDIHAGVLLKAIRRDDLFPHAAAGEEICS